MQALQEVTFFILFRKFHWTSARLAFKEFCIVGRMVLSSEKICKIRSAYASYGSLRAVGREVGCSQNTVRKYVADSMLIREKSVVNSLASNNEILIGLYVGLWMGDGTQYYDHGYTVKICCNKDNRLLNEFIKESLRKLFGKSGRLTADKTTRRAVIRLSSQFIFEFPYSYVSRGEHKTYTICLKWPVPSYSDGFLKGCLLGLMLSDGHLKKRAHFNVTSRRLANNMCELLLHFGFHPSMYVHRREKYGWRDLYMVSLSIRQSRQLEQELDLILHSVDCAYTFTELKNKMSPPGFEPGTTRLSVGHSIASDNRTS